LVIGDIMYIHTPFPNIVYALDLNDPGRVIWKYEPQQDPDTIPVMCCDTVNRGPAYAEGKIFLHQADTTLVALDAQTGEVVWTVTNGDPKKGETGTSAPMVIGDKVLIGISGGEFGVQGTGLTTIRPNPQSANSDFTFADKTKTTIFDIVSAAFASPIHVGIYVAAMIVVGVHVRHGFWSAFQSLGANHPKFMPALSALSVAAGLLVGFGFGLLPIFISLRF